MTCIPESVINQCFEEVLKEQALIRQAENDGYWRGISGRISDKVSLEIMRAEYEKRL